MDNQIWNFEVFSISLFIVLFSLIYLYFLLFLIYIHKYIWVSIGSQLRGSVMPVLRRVSNIDPLFMEIQNIMVIIIIYFDRHDLSILL